MEVETARTETARTEAARTEAARAVVAGTLHLARRLRFERSPASMSPGRLAILAFLRRHGEASPGEVAAAHQLQPQSVTRMLADMEDAGLIRRFPSPDDGRKAVLELTDAGRLAVADELRRGTDWVARAMADTLTPAEIQVLAVAGRLLSQLADFRD